MNFHDLLLKSKEYTEKRFSDLMGVEVDRIEKQLRLENRLASLKSTDSLLNFFRAIRDYPMGLDFLSDNRNFSRAIFLTTPSHTKLERLRATFFRRRRFIKNERVQLDNNYREHYQLFISIFLHSDLEVAIGEATAKSDYARLYQIVRFIRVLPEYHLAYLKSKLLDKLNFIELRLKGGVIGVFRDFEGITPILNIIQDQRLIQKSKTLQDYAAAISLKETQDSGIVSFFKAIGDLGDALGSNPKSIIEKEKKNEVLSGCGCAFSVIAMLLVVSLTFFWLFLRPAVKQDPGDYEAHNRRSNQFLQYLTHFDRDSVRNLKLMNPYNKLWKPLGPQFQEHAKVDYLFDKGPSIDNQSSYDLILFSNYYLGINDAPQAVAAYIGSQTSGTTRQSYVYRMYLGDSLSTFSTSFNEEPSSTKRFLNQPPFGASAIKYKFQFQGYLKKITIRDTLDRIVIDGPGVILYSPDGSKSFENSIVFPPN